MQRRKDLPPCLPGSFSSRWRRGRPCAHGGLYGLASNSGNQPICNHPTRSTAQRPKRHVLQALPGVIGIHASPESCANSSILQGCKAGGSGQHWRTTGRHTQHGRCAHGLRDQHGWRDIAHQTRRIEPTAPGILSGLRIIRVEVAPVFGGRLIAIGGQAGSGCRIDTGVDLVTQPANTLQGTKPQISHTHQQAGPHPSLTHLLFAQALGLGFTFAHLALQLSAFTCGVLLLQQRHQIIHAA